LFLAISAIPLGCAGGPYSYDDFIDDLRDSGASVEIGGEVTVGLFSVKGRVVMVNDELTNVLEFGNEALADEEATWVDPDGNGMEKVTGPRETIQVLWSLIGPQHFYKKGRLIVLYVDISSGSDPSTRNLLESILGSQFAGAP
jgi:hypothetical protein